MLGDGDEKKNYLWDCQEIGYQCERFSYDPYIFNLDMVALFVNKCGFLPYHISNLERYYQGIISFQFCCIA